MVDKTIIDGCNLAQRSQPDRRIDTVIHIDKNSQDEPTGAHVIISGLTLRNAGYGIRISSSDPDLTVKISDNHIVNMSDGGISGTYQGFPDNNICISVHNNRLEKNSMSVIILNEIKSAIVEKNLIRANRGGISVYADSVVMKNNLICENGPTYELISCAENKNIIFAGNTIAHNISDSITLSRVFDSFANNIFWGNSGDFQYDSNLYAYPYNCFQQKGHGDPNFAHLYKECAATIYESETSDILRINVLDISKFSLGDVIEYDFEGIPRIVNRMQHFGGWVEVCISPPLNKIAETNKLLFNWGKNPHRSVDSTISAGSQTMIYVEHPAFYKLGDVIEYNHDGIGRVVTQIVDHQVWFTEQPLSSPSLAGMEVINYSYRIDELNLDRDFHLTALSESCLDAGDPSYEPMEGETDLDGYARIMNGQVDIGAYEYCFYKVSAGADKQIGLGEIAFMEDAQILPAGAPCTVQWELVSAPVGSAYPLYHPLSAQINPSFGLDRLGEYVFKLSAYDGSRLVGSDTVTVKVGLYVDADAGAPYEAALVYDPSTGQCSTSVQLVGRVLGADPGTVQLLWGDPDNTVSQSSRLWEQEGLLFASKTITFYREGTYEIPLHVLNPWGRRLASDTAVVEIYGPNFDVEAGPDRQITWQGQPVTLSLSSRVIGYPLSQVDVHWRQVGGPAAVVFEPSVPGNPTQSGVPAPNVTFSQPGPYEFQFVAEHGWEHRIAQLKILVGSGVILSAGNDLYAPLENGQAVISTQNAYVYPNDGTLTIRWYCSGQLISEAEQPQLHLILNQPGNYELKLSVSDGTQEWSDTAWVHVYQTTVEPVEQVLVNPGTYDPVVLTRDEQNRQVGRIWLRDAFCQVVPSRPVTCSWTRLQGPQTMRFVQSSDGGITSTFQNPDVVFTEEGIYCLQLELFDSQARSLDKAQTTVVVLPENSVPPSTPADQIPPLIQLSALQNGQDITNCILTHGRIEISAHAVDSGSGMQRIQLYLNGQPITYIADQIHFPAALNLSAVLDVAELPQGLNRLRLQAWDRYTNEDSVEMEFIVSVPAANQPPIASVLNLQPTVSKAGPHWQTQCLKVVDTGLYELHGLAYHPEIDDQNVRYRLELFSQNG